MQQRPAKLEFNDDKSLRNSYLSVLSKTLMPSIPVKTKQNELDLDFLLNHDMNKISSIISNLNSYLADLSNRRTFSLRNRVIAVSIGASLLLILIPTGAYLIFQLYVNYYRWMPKLESFFDHFKNELIYSCIHVAADIIACGVAHPLRKLSSKPPSLPKSEWQELMIRINEALIKKLQSLEANDLNALPTDQQTIRDLETTAKLLETNKDLPTAITTFNQLKNTLESAQSQINEKQLPLTLFKPKEKVTPDVVIPINLKMEDKDSGDEQVDSMEVAEGDDVVLQPLMSRRQAGSRLGRCSIV